MQSKEITLGGILVALSVIILYGATILPINKIAILTLSAAIVPICIIRSNMKTGIMVFVASSLISFFLIPLNIWLLYVLVFGGYGIVKFYIEKADKESTEMILKFLYFNIIIFLGVFLAKALLGIDIFEGGMKALEKYVTVNYVKVYKVIVWALAQGAFFVIDYGLTLIITFYLDKIHNKIKK